MIKKEENIKHLFVYGTLMNGGGLHYLLLKKGFKFISKAKLNHYELYHHDRIPLIISGDGEVFGEVYEIKNSTCLKYLDVVEHNYDRIISDVICKGKKIKIFVYSYKYPKSIKNNFNFVKIEDGDFKIYFKTKEELIKKILILKKENKRLNKKKDYVKNTLFNFRQKCYGEMVSIDYGFYLSNDSFNKLFEKVINKFRKNQKEVKTKNGIFWRTNN